jgi:hypothetical protein
MPFQNATIDAIFQVGTFDVMSPAGHDANFALATRLKEILK